MRQLALFFVVTVIVAGCATTPTPLSGEFSQVTLEQARSQSLSGQRVRWGGEIVEVRPLDEKTCLEIMSRQLGASARPRETDATDGRFIACRPGFIDPAAFKPGREVTVVGNLEGVDSGKIGEFEYRFPRLAADTIYLWPKREKYDDRYRHYSPFFYDPFFWPYPYYSHRFYPYGPYFIPKAGSAQGSDS